MVSMIQNFETRSVPDENGCITEELVRIVTQYDIDDRGKSDVSMFHGEEPGNSFKEGDYWIDIDNVFHRAELKWTPISGDDVRKNINRANAGREVEYDILQHQSAPTDTSDHVRYGDDRESYSRYRSRFSLAGDYGGDRPLDPQGFKVYSRSWTFSNAPDHVRYGDDHESDPYCRRYRSECNGRYCDV